MLSTTRSNVEFSIAGGVKDMIALRWSGSVISKVIKTGLGDGAVVTSDVQHYSEIVLAATRSDGEFS